MSRKGNGPASWFVTLTAICLVGCADGPRFAQVEKGRTNLERLGALDRLAAQRGREGTAHERDLDPTLERLAVQDPFSEVRIRALELWLARPHPIVDDRLLLRILSSEPVNTVAIVAARAYHQLWGERGTRLLFQRFEECGTRPEVATTCYRLAIGLADDTRLSMSLLLETRDTRRSPRRVAEFALALASDLLSREPALRADTAVTAWLEAFASDGETAGIRATAKRLLSRPRGGPE